MRAHNLLFRTTSRTRFIYLFCLVLMIGIISCKPLSTPTAAVTATGLAASGAPANQPALPSQLTAVDLNDYEQFRTAMRPLLAKMGSKKVVALGEGTHGSSEFYKARFWITRLLIEEYGFTKVAFETDYTDALLLNELLQQGSQDYTPLMKKHLLSIWQNQEVEDLLKWIQAHNKQGKQKIDFLGIDHPFVSNDAKVIQQLLGSQDQAEIIGLSGNLAAYAAYQDSVWTNSNAEGFTFDRKQWFRNGVNAYQTIQQIEKAVPALKLPFGDREKLEGVLLNVKLAYDAFYQYDRFKRESSRDSSMAEMAAWIVRKKEDKLIVWAHNIHVGKQESWMNGYPVGGAGKFISRKLPGNYFVLGMGTSEGAFSATTDRIITNRSIMSSYPLEPPIAGSLERMCGDIPVPAFILGAEYLKGVPKQLLHRAVGFNPDSGESAYVEANVADLYDAFFFIKETCAGTRLE